MRYIDLANCYDSLSSKEINALLKSLKEVLPCIKSYCFGSVILPAYQHFSSEQLMRVCTIASNFFGDLGKCNFTTVEEGLIITVEKTSTLCKICKLSMYELGDKSNCKMQDNNIKKCDGFLR